MIHTDTARSNADAFEGNGDAKIKEEKRGFVFLFLFYFFYLNHFIFSVYLCFLCSIQFQKMKTFCSVCVFIKYFLPSRASRLTQRGIGFPVNLWHTSLQKWLQFFVIRWYVFPEYSSANFSMNARTSLGPRSVLPIRIDFLNVKPGHCFGSTSKIPVVEWSWAPKAYSTPWTGKTIKIHNQLF